MKYTISRSSAPEDKMPGDISDSRMVRLTIDMMPMEKMPRITSGPDGSLIVDLSTVHEETRKKLIATLSRRGIWNDITISQAA